MISEEDQKGKSDEPFLDYKLLLSLAKVLHLNRRDGIEDLIVEIESSALLIDSICQMLGIPVTSMVEEAINSVQYRFVLRKIMPAGTFQFLLFSSNALIDIINLTKKRERDYYLRKAGSLNLYSALA
jgi:hypothetical protein